MNNFLKSTILTMSLSRIKDRKFYRVVGARRESKWPRILAAISDTREVRVWPRLGQKRLVFDVDGTALPVFVK